MVGFGIGQVKLRNIVKVGMSIKDRMRVLKNHLVSCIPHLPDQHTKQLRSHRVRAGKPVESPKISIHGMRAMGSKLRGK